MICKKELFGSSNEIVISNHSTRMAFTRAVFGLLVLPLLRQVIAQSNNTLTIYSASSLNINAAADCITALTANVTCYSQLQKAVLETNSWSSAALGLICSQTCTNGLDSYVSSVDKACGSDTIYNISGTIQTASNAGREVQWKQSATCLTDPSSGNYCNVIFQQSSSGKDVACSNCALTYLTTLANSQWGQEIVDPAMVSRQVSSCSTTGYSITYTATATATSSTATQSTPLSEDSNGRCNTSDPTVSTYITVANQTCSEVSLAHNVSTPVLASINALTPNCTSLSANKTLCLPETCSIYRVSANDSCKAILKNNMTRQVELPTFRSWNPSINSACSNLGALEGQYICLRSVNRIIIWTLLTQ